MSFPKDPVMLLSVVNTQLRDHYASLDELCRAEDLDRQTLEARLATINYKYDETHNKFI